MKKITFPIVLIYTVGLLILIRSIILSGYRFQFNGDEVFNANIIYLMLKGLRPYADFYLGYSPILHWLLTPVFLLFGFTFKAVSVARIAMIAIFFIKTLLLFLLVKRIFGKKVAFIFLALFLLNPFTAFTEMQIRPDNIMMLFYTLFLLIFSYTYYSRSSILYIISGVLFGLTFLTHTKVAPSLAAFGLVFFFYTVQQKSLWRLWYFLNGFVLSCLVFLVYFLLKGNVGEMFLQVFLDPFRIYNRYPTWLGYFYFSNPVIYGHEGKPINWIYSWSLPVMAFAGGYQAVVSSVGNKDDNSLHLMKIILFLSLVFQWTSMLFINSVFMQYYIPINWLYALFSAFLIDNLIIQTRVIPLLQRGLAVFLLILLFFLFRSSILGNLARSRMTDNPVVKETKEYWQLIPEDSPAYPNVIFRKPIYPLLWGQVISENVRDRYPPVYTALEKYKPRILTGLNDDILSYLDWDSQRYIQSHYNRDSPDSKIWRRK